MTSKGYSTIQLLDDSEESDEELLDGKTAPSDLKFQEFGTVDLENTKPDNVSATTKLTLQDAENGKDQDTLELSPDKDDPSFWKFEYYQTFFDVDTDQVLARILGSMVPSRENFLLTKIRPDPDLYGPFWICTTLVFTIAICGNFSSFLASEGTHKWKSNFQLVSISAIVIFAYAWIVPASLWSYLIWRGNLAGYTFLEIVSAYGYSLAVFIPISILWVTPYDWLRWVLVIIGVFTSGSVLAVTFWRAVEDDNRRVAMITIVFIVILHLILAIGFKLYFFKSIRIHESVYHQRTVHAPPVPLALVTTRTLTT